MGPAWRLMRAQSENGTVRELKMTGLEDDSEE